MIISSGYPFFSYVFVFSQVHWQVLITSARCVTYSRYEYVKYEYVKCSDAWKYRKTLTTLGSSRTKRLLTFFLLLVFRHEERERHTHNFYYTDCSYIALQSTTSWTLDLESESQLTDPINTRRILLTQLDWPRPGPNLNSLTQQTRGASRGPNWTDLAQAQKSTSLAQRQISTNCFFQKSPKFSAPHFRAWRHSHPSHISFLGFLLWHSWLSHPPCTSVKCTQSVHLHVH